MYKIAVASAPAQSFLFGEHAVLYGYPAIACAVDVRSRVIARRREDKKVVLRSNAFKLEFRGENLNGRIKGNGPEGLSILAKCLEEILVKNNYREGIDITIRSEIPLASGMGSSASVAASMIKAVSAVIGRELSGEELLNEVYKAETRIHGRASKTGPAVSVYGGLVKIEWISGEMRISRVRDIIKLPLIMVYSGIKGETMKMIEKVKELKSRIPTVVENIMEAIGELVKEAEKELIVDMYLNEALMESFQEEEGKILTKEQEG